MSEDQNLRRKVLLRLLGSPLVIAPFVLGMTLCTATWALNWQPGLGFFAALAGALAAAGSLVTRLIFRSEEVTREVRAELEQENLRAGEAALDDLDRRLALSDQDGRPETALQDLRELLRAFHGIELESQTTQLANSLEVRYLTRQLFDQSVRSLEQTLHLGEIAARLKTTAAQRPILAQRELLIADVQGTVKQLGDTLAALQTLGRDSSAESSLAHLRAELDQSLHIARRVEERMKDFVTDATKPVADALQTTPNQNKG